MKTLMQLTIFGEEECIEVLPACRPKTFTEMVRESVDVDSIDMAELSELLAVIIGPKATPDLCEILAKIPMKELFSMSKSNFKELGLEEVPSVQLVAALGLAKRCCQVMKKTKKLKLEMEITIK